MTAVEIMSFPPAGRRLVLDPLPSSAGMLGARFHILAVLLRSALPRGLCTRPTHGGRHRSENRALLVRNQLT